jgi:hypothetical protein
VMDAPSSSARASPSAIWLRAEFATQRNRIQRGRGRVDMRGHPALASSSP